MRGVHDRIGQVEDAGGTKLGQQYLMQPLPHALLVPARQPRQHVDPETPNIAVGNCCQPIPVRSTNRIPASAARSSRGSRPG